MNFEGFETRHLPLNSEFTPCTSPTTSLTSPRTGAGIAGIEAVTADGGADRRKAACLLTRGGGKGGSGRGVVYERAVQVVFPVVKSSSGSMSSAYEETCFGFLSPGTRERSPHPPPLTSQDRLF